MKSKEEVIAMKISDLLSDIRIDPERIGFHLGHTPDPNIWDRLEEVFESTVLTRRQREERIKRMVLGLHLDSDI
mgnify:FL=1|jgi:hypothetical protein